MGKTKSAKKSVSLVLTGGTIGTKTQNGVRVLCKQTAENFAKKFGFSSFSSPFTVLSEDMDFCLLNILYKEVENKLENTDACIVAVGTDTLFFTAAYLALAFSKMEKTVVLVSASHPLDNALSNGDSNMNAALSFIETDFKGVFVAYKNENEDTKIHFGARLLYSRGFDGYVSSCMDYVAGVTKKGTVEFSKEFLKDTKINVDYKNKITRDELQFCNVLYLIPYVGINYGIIAKSIDKDTVILHDSFHSGTVKTSGDDNINNLKNKVYLAGGVSGEKYGSLLKLNQNIVPIDNISPVALYIKLLLSSKMDERTRDSYLKANTAYEFINI